MRRKNRLVLGLVTLTLGLGVVGGLAYASKGFQNWDVKTWVKQVEEVEPTKKDDDKKTEVNVGEFDSNIVCHGMRLMALQSGTNNDGTSYRTFGYTFNVLDPTITDVSYSLKFVDGSSCSEYVTCSIDSTTKTVTVNCLKAFPKQINLELYLDADPSISAVVKLDYEKRLTNVISKDNYVLNFIGNNYTSASGLVDSYVYGVGSVQTTTNHEFTDMTIKSFISNYAGSDGVEGSDLYNLAQHIAGVNCIKLLGSTTIGTISFDDFIATFGNKNLAVLYNNYSKFESTEIQYVLNYKVDGVSVESVIHFYPLKGYEEDFKSLVVLPGAIIPETTSIVF